jgi:hypothetical protein
LSFACFAKSWLGLHVALLDSASPALICHTLQRYTLIALDWDAHGCLCFACFAELDRVVPGCTKLSSAVPALLD